MEEKKGENIRVQVVEILREIAPDLDNKMDETVDAVHRVGRKMDNKVSYVIVLFAMR